MYNITYTFREGEYVSHSIKPGLQVKYRLQMPEGTEGPFGLVFCHDGFSEAAALAAADVAAEGGMPPCVFLGVWPGKLSAAVPGGYDRGMRMDNYDWFGPSYPDFIADELIPHIAETEGIRLSDSPDMHMIMGASSGGISAWNAAWFRTDYFRRVYMSSPSFLSMGNGREMPALIRKCETKPIRVWAEYSENEPDEYFGSSFAAAIDAVRALRYAGYDMEDRYFPKEGHSSRCGDRENLTDVMRFLWKGWQTEPVRAPRNSHRFDAVFDPADTWRKTDAFSPADHTAVRCPAVAGTYRAEGNRIYFEKDGSSVPAAELLREISALALSSDGWRLYAACRDAGCIYAMTVLPDGGLAGRYKHAALHTYTDFAFPGAADICTDGHDRIFAAAECGIQCVRPFGLIDVIAPLPQNAVPEALHIVTRADGTYLTVRTADAVWERRLAPYDPNLRENEPKPASYYD